MPEFDVNEWNIENWWMPPLYSQISTIFFRFHIQGSESVIRLQRHFAYPRLWVFRRPAKLSSVVAGESVTDLSYLSLTSLPSLVNTKTTTFLVQKGPEKQTLLVIIFALDLGYSPFEQYFRTLQHIRFLNSAL